MEFLEQFKIQLLYQKVWIFKRSENGVVYYEADCKLQDKVRLEAKNSSLDQLKADMRKLIREELDRLNSQVPGRSYGDAEKQQLDSADQVSS